MGINLQKWQQAVYKDMAVWQGRQCGQKDQTHGC